MLYPQARQGDDIVVQELFDEIVIYDLKRDKIHALNPTSTFVWRHCNGQRTWEELTDLLQQEFQTPQADALLTLTLDRLEKAHLLAKKMPPITGHQTITRREVLKLAGVTVALLPVVKSIVAPTVAHAQSPGCVGRWELCDPDGLPCCEGTCRRNFLGGGAYLCRPPW